MAKPWFKVWRTAWSDEAILKLSAAERWLFFTFIKLADEGKQEGRVILPDYAIINAMNLELCECDPDCVEVWPTNDGIQSLVDGGLISEIEGGYEVVNYHAYQAGTNWGGKRPGSGRPSAQKTPSKSLGNNQADSVLKSRPNQEAHEIGDKRFETGELEKDQERAVPPPAGQVQAPASSSESISHPPKNGKLDTRRAVRFIEDQFFPWFLTAYRRPHSRANGRDVFCVATLIRRVEKDRTSVPAVSDAPAESIIGAALTIAAREPDSVWFLRRGDVLDLKALVVHWQKLWDRMLIEGQRKGLV